MVRPLSSPLFRPLFRPMFRLLIRPLSCPSVRPLVRFSSFCAASAQELLTVYHQGQRQRQRCTNIYFEHRYSCRLFTPRFAHIPVFK